MKNRSYLLLPILLWTTTVAGAQSFSEPTRPIIKQALALKELTPGANVDTEFDEYASATVGATYSPAGPFGIYLAGGPLFADYEGIRFSAGLAFTVKEPTQILTSPAVQLHGGVSYSSFEVDELADDLEDDLQEDEEDEAEEEAAEEESDEFELEASRFDIPLAVGLFWSMPVATSNFQAWVSPRGHIRITDVEGGSSNTDVGFGASLGLQYAHRTGPGAYVGGDLLVIDDGSGEMKAAVEIAAGIFYILNLN